MRMKYFVLSLATSEENPRPLKEGVYKAAVTANNVQLHVWLTAQCRSDSASTSSYAYAQHQPNYNYSVNSNGCTFASF